MHVEIVSIGEELLSSDSDTIDTNSVFITKALGKIGLRVLYKTTVGDDESRITAVLKLALSRADIVITTGGLGPTIDDMTRQGVANATDRPLALDETLLAELTEKFARFGVRMSDNNIVQATLPRGAGVLANPIGTAPGFYIEQTDKLIYSVPGVPREMNLMIDEQVVPRLKAKLGDTGLLRTRVLRTAGIGESHIDERIGHLEKLANPTVGLNAHSGQTDIRITARAADEAEAEALIAPVEAEIRQKLGDFIYGVDRDSLDIALLETLRTKNLPLAIVEHGATNLFYTRLAAQPNAAQWLVPIAPEMAAQAVADFGSSPNPKANAEAVAKYLLQQTGQKLLTVILSTSEGTAVCVANQAEQKSRAYAYGAHEGSHAWAVGWAVSMTWHLAGQTHN
jgi:nicotinamide-nucleotide amidase